MENKICPRCESEEINLVTGGITGEWECQDCRYANDIFPEKNKIKTKEKE